FSPDGKTLATSSYQAIKLWDARTLAEKASLDGHTDSVFGVSFSPDGKRLVSASTDTTVRLWDVEQSKEVRTFQSAEKREEERPAILAATYAPSGKVLALGGEDHTVQLRDAVSGSLLATLAGHEDPVTCLSFSPDGKTLATGSPDTMVRLWDVE